MRSGNDEAGGGDGQRIIRLLLIAGELPAHERVERQVVVQAADDEVPIMMGRGSVRALSCPSLSA